MSQSLSQSIHMLHLAAQRYRDQIIKPHDGILAQTDQLQIERGAGRTEYRIKDGGNWSTASWRHGTFLHDRADDVAWAPSGNLWVLQDGRLRCLRTDKSRDGLALTDQTLALSRSVQQIDTLPIGRIGAELSDHERMELDESRGRLLEWSPVTGPVILATSDIADQKLDWCWLSDGHLATAWRSGAPNLKLWSQDNDCLAMQSVSDIAMDEQGNLLLITEMGLIVRDAGNYALKALYPEIPAQTRFVRLIGPQRTLLRVDEQFAYEWDGNRLRPLSGRDRMNAASSLDSGPWRWQLPIGPTSRGPVTINHRDNGRPRHLASVNTGGLKFQDDCVNWIARDSQASQIWLNTDDGMWRFHPTTGRTASTDASDQTSPGDPPLAVHTPAISMDYAHGRIIMHAYDGGPVYEQGRFFHDQASSLSSRPNGLYLLNQRCMIRRDGEKPGRITACWPLPPLLDAARPVKLGSDSTAIRCMGSDLLGQLHLWELQGDTWQDLGEPPQQSIASIGPVDWFADAVEDRCEPRLGSTSAVVIDHWWSKDRFAWDRVLSASPLSATQLIVQTPMGLVAMRCGINDSAFQISAIWPQTGLTYCEPARDNGRQIGVVAGNMAGDAAFLVTEDIAGQPHCTRTDDPAPLRRRAQVSLVQSNPQGDLESRRIDWRLSWQQAASSVAALTSALDGLDMRNMLRDGQFLSDRADCACELDVAGGRLWLMAASGQGAADSGLVCLNRIADDAGETQHAPLLLADILDRRSFLAMRSAGPDAVWGLQDQAESAPQIWIGTLTTGALTWSRDDSSQARAAFEVGQSVHLDVAAMRWSAQPRSRWEHSTDVFQWQPAGYPLFQSAAMGTTLSFDMLHSLSLDRAQRRLLIATSGGIVDCPYDPADGSISLSDTSTRLRWESNGQSLVPATRIRLDQSGDVWLMPGQQNQSICLGHSTGSPPWSKLDYNGRPIDLHRQGFSWCNRQYNYSYDAWLPQRRTLTDVVEATVDVNHDTMWLVTESGGLVKVRPKHLPP